MTTQTTKPQGLTRQQKESVFLLSLGTFLEYFDLMLYIHMAVLLNELFFPQTDPGVAKILGAFAFASTFLFRPIGGFIIGRIGDKIGRKKTVMITTFTMAACCITMAVLPTYAEIGITASVIMILCRALQGFSSMGELTGAQLYIMESFKQPHRYVFCVFIYMQAALGTTFALGTALFATTTDTLFGWRLAFVFGAVIAVVGLAARTKLRETPEFVDYTRRLKIKKAVTFFPKKNENQYDSQRVNIKTALCLWIQFLIGAIAYCSAYVYVGNFMKDSLGFSPQQIINQNLKFAILSVALYLSTVVLLKKNHPVKIARSYAVFSLVTIPFIPYLFDTVNSSLSILLLQLILILPNICENGFYMVFFRHFPVTNRFTAAATIAGLGSLFFAFAPTLIILITKYFGNYGLSFIFLCNIVIQLFSLNYLRKLEESKGCYSDYPEVRIKSVEYPADYNFKTPSMYAGYDIDCKYSTMLLNKLIGTKTIDQRLVEKAMLFCKKWHDGQFRKSGEPYYTHPFTVADMVVEYIPSTDVVIGALLHDVVEDTECTLKLIKEEFNERVAQIVERLTRIKTDENGNKTKVSVEALISEMKRVDDQESLLIKEIDRLHNLVTIESMSEEKQQQTSDETIEHVVPNAAYAVDATNINNKLNLEGNLLDKSK